jgi:hypothetical protein
MYSSSFIVLGGVPGMRPAEVRDTTVVELSWSATAEHLRGARGERRFLCPANGHSFLIWGTDTYSDQSSICGAAVHAGVITSLAGGEVKVNIEPGRSDFNGSLRNGVLSRAAPATPVRFSFVRT